MDTRTKTKRFQKEVSEKLTKLFVDNLRQNGDIKEILEILTVIVNKNGGDNDNKISVHKILECVNEPETFYFKNDNIINRFGQERGERIYSPRIDLSIAPTFVRKNERKGRCFMNILLPDGSRSHIYELFERFSIIQKLKEKINANSNENYRLINIERDNNYERNRAPLYLFGIEIENSFDKKHLVGDFLNSYILSKYPLVLIPENQMDIALDLIKYIHVVKGLKGINFTSLSNVNLLSIKQFKLIINEILIEYNIEPMEMDSYG